MMPKQLFAAAWIVVASLGWPAWAQDAGAIQVHPPTCAPAVEYVMGRISQPVAAGMPWIVAGGTIDLPSFVTARQLRHSAWLTDAGVSTSDRPSYALAVAFVRNHAGDALSICPELAQRLDDARAAHGDEAVQKAYNAFRRGEGQYSVLSSLMPTLSADGRQALLLVSAYGAGGLGGGITIVHMRQDKDGHWAVTGIMVIASG